MSSPTPDDGSAFRPTPVSPDVTETNPFGITELNCLHKMEMLCKFALECNSSGANCLKTTSEMIGDLQVYLGMYDASVAAFDDKPDEDTLALLTGCIRTATYLMCHKSISSINVETADEFQDAMLYRLLDVGAGRAVGTLIIARGWQPSNPDVFLARVAELDEQGATDDDKLSDVIYDLVELLILSERVPMALLSKHFTKPWQVKAIRLMADPELRPVVGRLMSAAGLDDPLKPVLGKVCWERWGDDLVAANTNKE